MHARLVRAGADVGTERYNCAADTRRKRISLPLEAKMAAHTRKLASPAAMAVAALLAAALLAAWSPPAAAQNATQQGPVALNVTGGGENKSACARIRASAWPRRIPARARAS
jgi:hypothetical protein